MRLGSVLAILTLMFVSTSVMASAKTDFIDAVKAQCKKNDADAKALATPGRSGNVIKYKTCTGATVTVGDCTLSCAAKGKIGG